MRQANTRSLAQKRILLAQVCTFSNMSWIFGNTCARLAVRHQKESSMYREAILKFLGHDFDSWALELVYAFCLLVIFGKIAHFF